QYHRPRRKGRDDCWAYWQVSPRVWWNKWREPCEDPRLAKALAALPGNVYMVEATTQMVALYWGERGDESVLQNIAQTLEDLA
ncbi:hypothetical protein ACNPOQ_27320, partial [Pseudomonas shirazensis]